MHFAQKMVVLEYPFLKQSHGILGIKVGFLMWQRKK
jgi:hypothetical protein